MRSSVLSAEPRSRLHAPIPGRTICRSSNSARNVDADTIRRSRQSVAARLLSAPACSRQTGQSCPGRRHPQVAGGGLQRRQASPAVHTATWVSAPCGRRSIAGHLKMSEPSTYAEFLFPPLMSTRCASVSVTRSAAKLSLRGLIATLRRRTRGSRVAAGYAPSALALDACVRLRHLRPQSRVSPLIYIEHVQHC